jgi:hypothetical protein
MELKGEAELTLLNRKAFLNSNDVNGEDQLKTEDKYCAKEDAKERRLKARTAQRGRPRVGGGKVSIRFLQGFIKKKARV